MDKHSVPIDVNTILNMDTKKLSAKLKAIAKHAEALANELDVIDEDSCPECSALMDVMKFHSDYEVINGQSSCSTCGYTTNNK